MTGPTASGELLAVDIGNSRVKLGWFEAPQQAPPELPTPVRLETQPTDDFEPQSWAQLLAAQPLRWLVSSVHRRAAGELARWVSATRPRDDFRLLTFRDIPLPLEVAQPERVGMDRLLAATAANQVRRKEKSAIVVAIGSAITVNLITPGGSFSGGAILPGVWMSAQALAGRTDALPLVAQTLTTDPPAPVGRSTEQAIASGLYWGAVGAIRELSLAMLHECRLAPASNGLSAESCDLFFTGGDAARFAEQVAPHAQYHEHLVLSGLACLEPSIAW